MCIRDSPRPHFSSRPKRFGSHGPCENVRPFPARSPRIRHRNELTERDWENTVQGLGKGSNRIGGKEVLRYDDRGMIIM